MKVIGKTGIGFLVGMLLTTAVSLQVLAQAEAKITGDWDLTVSATEGERQVVITFKMEGEKLTGALNTTRAAVPFESVTLLGEDISWVLKMTLQGQESIFSFKGKAQGNTMKGDAELGPYGKGNWAATKRAVTPPVTPGTSGISGIWKCEFHTPDGMYLAEFTVNQEGEKLTGSLKGPFGESPVTGTVQGSEVTFAFQVNYQGQPMKIQGKGKLENPGAMNGTYTYNEQGPSTWVAKK